MTRRLPTAAELNAAERADQGLPRYVEDRSALERVATLIEPRRQVERPTRREEAA